MKKIIFFLSIVLLNQGLIAQNNVRDYTLKIKNEMVIISEEVQGTNLTLDYWITIPEGLGVIGEDNLKNAVQSLVMEYRDVFIIVIPLTTRRLDTNDEHTINTRFIITYNEAKRSLVFQTYDNNTRNNYLRNRYWRVSWRNRSWSSYYRPRYYQRDYYGGVRYNKVYYYSKKYYPNKRSWNTRLKEKTTIKRTRPTRRR